MKKFTLTISVDEDKLKQAYLDRQDLIEEDLPSTSELISQEFGWLEDSGIFPISIEENLSLSISLGTDNSISWCVEDVQEVAIH